MLNNNRWIFLAGAIWLLLLVVVPLMALRLVLAIPLVLFMPGFTLIFAVFPPGRESRSPGNAERLLFSLGLSLALTAFTGLALNLTPWGLQAGPWLAVLVGLTLLFTLIGLYRSRSKENRVEAETQPRSIGLNLYQGGLILAAVVLVAGAIVLSRTPTPEQGFQGYTQLWILPGQNTSVPSVRLGVQNSEFFAVEYHLVLTQNGQQLADYPSIKLNPGQKWEQDCPLTSASTQPIKATLYRADMPALIYREVTLWPAGQ